MLKYLAFLVAQLLSSIDYQLKMQSELGKRMNFQNFQKIE